MFWSRPIRIGAYAAAVLSSLAIAWAQSLPESSSRAGLPNLFAKLTSGKAVRIAYLGGSITAQPGWRPKTLQWFQKQFPTATVEEINAAIGGTGSDLGVFRLKHDVLDHDPDLLFVEFAVNDAGAPPAQIHRCVEGIVRQTWRHNPETDICFVYTLAGGMLETLKQEKLPPSYVAMEQIAEHYAIPSINLGLEVARLEKAGKLLFQGPLPKTETEKAALGGRLVFSPDAVHPYPETGHELYLEAVVRSMEIIRRAGEPGAHPIPVPFTADNWEAAQMIPLSRAKMSSGWERLDSVTNTIAKRFGDRLPEVWKASQPGASISFRFRGTAAQVYDLLGPDCGQVIVKIDQEAPVVKPRFDSFCTYHRLATLRVAEGLSNSVHSVDLTIHPEQPDKAKILSQRNEKMDDPKRYDGTAWYAGAILLLGELADEPTSTGHSGH